MYSVKENTLYCNGKKVTDFDQSTVVRNTRYFYKDGAAVANVSIYKIDAGEQKPDQETQKPPRGPKSSKSRKTS